MAPTVKFKLEAFKQDIENLIATLDSFEMTYQLDVVPIEIKDDKGVTTQNTTIGVPRFAIPQFLGRLCTVLEDLQLANHQGAPPNEGLVARCPEHGTEAEGSKFMYFDGKAFCLTCLCEQNACEAQWSSPEEGDDGLCEL